MRDNKIFEQSLKMAEQFAKDVDNVPKLFESMLSEVLPKATPEEKIKLQQLVKESNKVIEDARKTGDFVKIKQSIDELTAKHGRNSNT
tara:strand:- start:1810 stop:2073 length:264 start_codon:yes stop_codon:yes gene_type:complete